MPIEYRAPGEATLVGQLAVKAGQAEASQRAAAQAQQMQSQIMQIQASREEQAIRMQEARAVAKVQAAARVREQTFDAQVQQQAIEQSKAWEVQKMALRSQSDFAMAEKENQLKGEYEIQKSLRQRQEFDRKMEDLTKSKAFSPVQKEEAIQNAWAEYVGMQANSFSWRRPAKQPAKADAMSELYSKILGPSSTPTSTAPGTSGGVAPNAPVPQNPYINEYPDAFPEGGVWKVIRNGKKMRIE
jgi:hypothetical protein